MKILLIGKNGQLGWELNKVLPALGNLVSLGRSELDLSNSTEIKRSLMDIQPEVIINAAAYTEVDRAEIEPNAALQINAQAPGILAEIARKLSAVMIHYSTDYVFDGKDNRPYTEDDRVNPLNEYGKSKYLGEENIKQAGDSYLIFRTSWVYSMLGNSFVNKVLGWSRKNTTLKIVNDQISNPTWARMLAEFSTSALIKNSIGPLENIREIRGIYHLGGIGYTSRYEWAKWILAHDPNRTEQLVQAIEPVSSDEFPTPAIRPPFSALDCSKFEGTFNLRIPDWKISLQEAMKG
jgi:dTDP-4-dehydrorhamnose reductase